MIMRQLYSAALLLALWSADAATRGLGKQHSSVRRRDARYLQPSYYDWFTSLKKSKTSKGGTTSGPTVAPNTATQTIPPTGTPTSSVAGMPVAETSSSSKNTAGQSIFKWGKGYPKQPKSKIAKLPKGKGGIAESKVKGSKSKKGKSKKSKSNAPSTTLVTQAPAVPTLPPTFAPFVTAKRSKSKKGKSKKSKSHAPSTLPVTHSPAVPSLPPTSAPVATTVTEAPSPAPQSLPLPPTSAPVAPTLPPTPLSTTAAPLTERPTLSPVTFAPSPGSESPVLTTAIPSALIETVGPTPAAATPQPTLESTSLAPTPGTTSEVPTAVDTIVPTPVDTTPLDSNEPATIGPTVASTTEAPTPGVNIPLPPTTASPSISGPPNLLPTPLVNTVEPTGPSLAPVVSLLPVFVSESPAAGSLSPVTASETPVSGSLSPIAASPAPVAGGTTTPVAGTTPPVPISGAPVIGGTPTPVVGTAPPFVMSAVPVAVTLPPAVDTEAPVATTAAPGPTTEAPVASTSPPVVATGAPVAVTPAPSVQFVSAPPVATSAPVETTAPSPALPTATPTLANVRVPDPYTITYEGVTGTPTPEQFDAAAAITTMFVTEYLRQTLSFENSQLEQFPATVVFTGTDPITISFEAEATFATDSQYVPTKDQLNLLIESAFVQPNVETLLLLLGTLPPDNPYSMATGATYAKTPPTTPEPVSPLSAVIVGAVLGAATLGFIIGTIISRRRGRPNRRELFGKSLPLEVKQTEDPSYDDSISTNQATDEADPLQSRNPFDYDIDDVEIVFERIKRKKRSKLDPPDDEDPLFQQPFMVSQGDLIRRKNENPRGHRSRRR